jgi:archaellum component FlaC
MNAVMHKFDLTEDPDMPTGENDNLALQVTELRADVGHIQADITDIKADQRVTHQRIESLRRETAESFEKVDQRFGKVDDRFDSLRKETAEGFGKVDDKLESIRRETAERFDKIDPRFGKVDDKFESLRKETAEGFGKVDDKFESVRKEICEVKDSLSSAKVWALGLYLALAGSLLYVLARGFRWF